MTTRENILSTLRIHKSTLSKYGIDAVGLYGSYSRDEQHYTSDIDLLIDFTPESENFDNFMVVCDYLESLFGGEKVEIVTKNGLSPYIGPRILEEVIYV